MTYPRKKRLVYTHKKASFGASIVDDNGTRKLIFTAPLYFQQFLRTLKVDSFVSIIVTSKMPKRTQAQNNYYWGIYLPLIAKETGEDDIEGLHELFKGMFLDEGIKNILGKPVRKKGSTTNLPVGGFCEYILKIERETGVLAPPTENYNLAPLRNPVHARRVE